MQPSRSESRQTQRGPASEAPGKRDAARTVLVCNAGSSSLKAALFNVDLSTGPRVSVAEIGGDAQLTVEGEAAQGVRAGDHASALETILAVLKARGIAPDELRAVGHRVVHGGARLTGAVRLDRGARDEIAASAGLAPLHNPPALRVIDELARRLPEIPQTASFDTAFHAGNPDVATRYALPDIPGTDGLRRYGFHGISYASLTASLPVLSDAPLPRRLLAFHLGNGASACAIRDGHSVATTMGYSPLDGLTMGTRPGNLDPEAVLTLADRLGVAGARDLLNREAGLKGLAGESDMRALLSSDRAEARFAVAHFCHWAVCHGGALIAAMGGCDAIAFTGGIGEHAAPVRAAISEGFGWLGARLEARANAAGGPCLHAAQSQIALWVVPAREEEQIARDARALVTG